ncbi:hypothetical protein Ancab_022951 [Ancistrocladus abbreviatus]
MFIPFHSLIPELSKSYQTLSKTKQLHALIRKTHLSLDPFFATKISRFYALNDDLSSARNLFDEMPDRSVFLWNSIIRAYARNQDFHNAFRLVKEMLTSESVPDSFTFACLARGCAENLDVCGLRCVHGGLLVFGLGVDSVCSSSLVSAYSKLGLVDKARKVFDRVVDPDLPMWNSMISGYGCCGFWNDGLRLFSAMRNIGEKPDGYTMVALLLGLADPSLLGIGQGVHGFCLKGFSQAGDNSNALHFFRAMNREGMNADPVVIVSALAASAQLAIAGPGCELHGYVLRHGLEIDVMVSSAVIDMYSKCGFIDLALQVFRSLSRQNIVMYNSVILGLGSHGLASQAFAVFYEMLEKGLEPDESTFFCSASCLLPCWSGQRWQGHFQQNETRVCH